VVGDQVHSLRRHLRSLRRSRKYVTSPAVRERPGQQRRPLISEPGPVDFSQYGMVARMWMEQVDDCCCQSLWLIGPVVFTRFSY